MKGFYIILLSFLISGNVNAASESVRSYQSPYSAKATADRFEALLEKKGLRLFARIDHQKNASEAGLTLRSSEVIIFGNPKVGTPLMQCAQIAAIDLPQKVLITETASGEVLLSYNVPEYIKERHQIEGCDKLIIKIAKVLSSLATAVTTK